MRYGPLRRTVGILQFAHATTMLTKERLGCAVSTRQCVESWTPCSPVISANRHSALINRICSIVRARDSSRRGLATMQARQIARETATLRRLREKRKSRVRGTSSALEVAIE